MKSISQIITISREKKPGSSLCLIKVSGNSSKEFTDLQDYISNCRKRKYIYNPKRLKFESAVDEYKFHYMVKKYVLPILKRVNSKNKQNPDTDEFDYAYGGNGKAYGYDCLNPG